MAALADRGDESPHPVAAGEGSETKTWWQFMSTTLIPESKPMWCARPIMTINQKNDFKSEQKVEVTRPQAAMRLLPEVSVWREILTGNCLPFRAGLLNPCLGWPLWPQALCPLILTVNYQSPLSLCFGTFKKKKEHWLECTLSRLC